MSIRAGYPTQAGRQRGPAALIGYSRPIATRRFIPLAEARGLHAAGQLNTSLPRLPDAPLRGAWKICFGGSPLLRCAMRCAMRCARCWPNCPCGRASADATLTLRQEASRASQRGYWKSSLVAFCASFPQRRPPVALCRALHTRRGRLRSSSAADGGRAHRRKQGRE
jgi:hypothetical protein